MKYRNIWMSPQTGGTTPWGLRPSWVVSGPVRIHSGGACCPALPVFGKGAVRLGLAGGRSVLSASHSSTLRGVLEYLPQSTPARSARRFPSFRFFLRVSGMVASRVVACSRWRCGVRRCLFLPVQDEEQKGLILFDKHPVCPLPRWKRLFPFRAECFCFLPCAVIIFFITCREFSVGAAGRRCMPCGRGASMARSFFRSSGWISPLTGPMITLSIIQNCL